MDNKEMQSRIAELEVELAVKESTIADLRDYNKRAAIIAAEECDKQKAELEALLAEAKAEVWLRSEQRDTAEASESVYKQRAEAAEADNARLRTALEEIAEGRFYCADGDCRAIETTQAALSAEQPDEWRFCERDEKCYLKPGHSGECAKTKERRRSYTEQPADANESE